MAALAGWLLILASSDDAAGQSQAPTPPAGKAAESADRMKPLAAGRVFETDRAWPKPTAEGPSWGEMSGLCLDHQGHLWAFHRGKVPVEIYDRSGARLAAWGEGQFVRPHQVRVDAKGLVWLVDAGLHVVRQYDTDGRLLRTLGTPGKAGADEARFDQPTDVAVAPTGEIYVADGYGNDRVVKFDAEGRFVKAWGKKGTGPGEFDLPHSIVIDPKGRLLVADRSNGRVQVFDTDGNYLDEWAGVVMPWHLVIGPKGEIFVCGSSWMARPLLSIPGIPRGIPPKDQIVSQFDHSGRELMRWTFPVGREAGELDWVHGMAIDASGVLYLGDIRGRRVQRFLPIAGPLADRPKADPAVKQAGGEQPK